MATDYRMRLSLPVSSAVPGGLCLPATSMNTTGGTTMKRTPLDMAVLAAAVLGASLLLGCGKPAEVEHAGTWELDIQVVKDAMAAEIAGIEDPEERQAMEFGMAMIGSGMLDAMKMTLTLNADGTASSTTSMMGESETVQGTWSARGNRLTIEMVQDNKSEEVSAVVEGDTLELIPPDDEEMPFRMIMRRQTR
jgi:hypothetical protein